MKFQPGQSGNPAGRVKDKPIRDALRMELAANELGDPVPVKPGTYRALARAMINKAQNGDVSAFEAIANRIDGKVPQGVIGGDDEDNPVRLITRIERIIVYPDNPDGVFLGRMPTPEVGTDKVQ